MSAKPNEAKPNEATCPQCNGSGRFFPDREMIGGSAITCGACHGAGVCSPEAREFYLDACPISRGEVKAMIAEAIAAAMGKPKP